VKLLFNGRGGKVGSVLAPLLEANGHTLVDRLDDAEAMVDFTTPGAALPNVRAAVDAGVPSVVGTSGWDTAQVADAPVAVFYAPNFAIGAVLMMRFAAEAARYLGHAEIVELHHETKLDAPSGTAKRTAELMDGDVPIHSVRLPGIVADQDVILGDTAQTLTLRHVTTDRTSFMPGVLMAVRQVATLPDPLTIGLDRLLWPEG